MTAKPQASRPASDTKEHTTPPTRVGIDGWVWIAVIAISPLQQFLFESGTPEVRLVPLGAALLSLLLARVAYIRGQGVLTTAAVLIVVAGFISGTNSSVTASASVAIMLALLIAIVPSALAFQVARSRAFLTNAVVGFVGVQTISALAAIVQMAGGSTFGIVAVADRARGFAGHPNVLGIMSVIVILVLLEVWRRRAIARPLTMILLAVHGIAIAGSASLSSMLMLAVGLAFYAFAIKGAARYILWTLLLVSLIGAAISSNGDLTSLIPDTLETRIDQVTEVGGDRASWNIRVGAYEFALRSIALDPFTGVGMDAMNESTTQPGLAVHNYLLRGWYQGGLLLLISFLTVTIVFVLSVARYIRQTGNIAPAAILISMLVFGMTAALYTQSHYWMVLLTAFVAMGGLRPSQVKLSKSTIEPSLEHRRPTARP